MTTDIVIVRYSELGLKGKNRNEFEKRLVNNIRICLEKNDIPYEKVWRIRGRIFITTASSCNELKNVFGIQTFSPAVATIADMGSITESAEGFLAGVDKDTTFRVSAHRGDKAVPFTSEDLERGIGAHIVETTGAKVSLKAFSFELGIEIFEGKAYVFSKRSKGPGGLPFGSSGKVCVIYETERSIAATWLMMKRGCSISIICEKTEEGIEKLKEIAYGPEIQVIEGGLSNFPDQEAAVSEQDIENLSKYDIDAIILRPLVGYSKEEIEEIISKVY